MTEEKEGNQEILVTKYVPSIGNFKTIYLGIWPHAVNISLILSQGQVGVDGERGRSGAPGPPVSVKT